MGYMLGSSQCKQRITGSLLHYLSAQEAIGWMHLCLGARLSYRPHRLSQSWVLHLQGLSKILGGLLQAGRMQAVAKEGTCPMRALPNGAGT